ncbi:MAG: ABC transporter substrate-binding protein [Flavobacteriales bacterium]|nr:ABC transporter substrate-binding protein [Flavobacteriales bacterium]
MNRFFALIFILFFFGCTEPKPKQTFQQDGSGEVKIEYARGLLISKNGDGFEVTVRNPQDTSEILGNYSLVSKSDSGEHAIHIPIESAALSSTTFVAFFDVIEQVDRISGVTFTDRVMNANLLQNISKGKVRELTESTPLGRAEWIKFAGCLTGKLDEATAKFDSIASAYHALKQKAESQERPEVFTGSRYKDHWYAPGRDSYIATYIRDAAAEYTFNEIEGRASAELDMESVLVSVSDADFWGMVVSQEKPYTMDQLLEIDPMYTRIKAVKDSSVFVCNAAKSDYFGDAVMQPHIILADLVSVFHPELLPDHEPVFFSRIKERQ